MRQKALLVSLVSRVSLARTRAASPAGLARLAGGLAIEPASIAAVPRFARADEGPPSGPWIEGRALRPRDAATARVCSYREPICVHGDIAPGALLAVLASAERAWEVETGALALPAPDADLETGAYDLYVVPGVSEDAVTAASARDPRSRVDRASAYSLLDASLALGGSCPRDTAVAASVARAALFRAAPATVEATSRAEAAYFARLAVPCAMGALGDVEVFQATPRARRSWTLAAITTRAPPPPSSEAPRSFTGGSTLPTPLSPAASCAPSGPSPPPDAAWRRRGWNDEPDGCGRPSRVVQGRALERLDARGALRRVRRDAGARRAARKRRRAT